jgi:hypothetical protein
MSTCVVSGTVKDVSGTPISGIPVSFNIQNPTLTTDPVQASTSSASDGTWSVTLAQGLSGVFTISVPPSNLGRPIPYRFNVNVPSAATATFASILVDN